MPGQLIKEVLLDGSYVRFALLATTPFGFLLAIVGRKLKLGPILTTAVFLHLYHRKPLAGPRPRRALSPEQFVLLWKSARAHDGHPPAYHYPNARLQRGIGRCYHPYHRITEKSHHYVSL
jgi:hypothetical protein